MCGQKLRCVDRSGGVLAEAAVCGQTGGRASAEAALCGQKWRCVGRSGVVWTDKCRSCGVWTDKGREKKNAVERAKIIDIYSAGVYILSC